MNTQHMPYFTHILTPDLCQCDWLLDIYYYILVVIAVCNIIQLSTGFLWSILQCITGYRVSKMGL